MFQVPHFHDYALMLIDVHRCHWGTYLFHNINVIHRREYDRCVPGNVYPAMCIVDGFLCDCDAVVIVSCPLPYVPICQSGVIFPQQRRARVSEMRPVDPVRRYGVCGHFDMRMHVGRNGVVHARQKRQ